MKLLRKILGLLLIGVPGLITPLYPRSETPQLSVIIVIDQFAYHHIRKLSPHFKFGFKYLLKNGINFTNAHHPHGLTCTATGHAALGTGTLAKDHGIVLNGWLDEQGNAQGFKDDEPHARSFNGLHPTKTCGYGISAKNVMVDGLSDQLILSSTPEVKNRVYSISYKPRAAIGMGGHLGKSIWFDHNTVAFTSSKSFFKKLPNWLIQFNKKNDITKIKKVEWKTCYPASDNAYDFENINAYEFASKKAPRANSTINTISKRKDCTCNLVPDGKATFTKLPQANQLLLDLASSCLKSKFKPHRKEPGKFMLWVSLSTLDMIGHAYGPESLEVIDMIYHLDKQLMTFIKQVKKIAGNRKILFVLTSDHGVTPIPEHSQKKGLGIALRIQKKKLLKNINKAILQQFGIQNIISDFKTGQLYLDKKIVTTLSETEKNKILQSIKTLIKQEPGIHEVWTADELKNATFSPSQIESYYKNQYYPGRSGDIICMTKPYCSLNKRATGTTHCSPYEYDTHVPLIMYQAGKLQKKTINSQVWIPQVPVTIAKILGIQPPSASHFQELPGILPQAK